MPSNTHNTTDADVPPTRTNIHMNITSGVNVTSSFLHASFHALLEEGIKELKGEGIDISCLCAVETLS